MIKKKEASNVFLRIICTYLIIDAKITFDEALKLFLYVDDRICGQGFFPRGRFCLQVNTIVERKESLLVVPSSSAVSGRLLGRAGSNYLSRELLARYQGKQRFLHVTEPEGNVLTV